MGSKYLPKLLWEALFWVITVIFALKLFAFSFPNPIGSSSSEARLQLKHLYQLQDSHFKLNSTYSTDFDRIGFEVPKTILEEGHSRYTYKISFADDNKFIAHARAVQDFDNDGNINLLQIGEDGILKEVIPD